MAEYIEREALLQALEEIGGCDAPSDSWADGWDRGILSAIRLIEGQPTADKDDVHGHWIEWHPPMRMIMTGEELLYRCSVCDAKYPDVEGYRYCPHCGARMDGDTE